MRRRPARSQLVEPIRRSGGVRGVRGPDLNGNYKVCCPFCLERVGREDEEFKLTIKVSGETAPRKDREPVKLSPERGAWNCYRCDARGYADFRWLGVDEEAPREPERDRFREDLEDARAHFVPLAEAARSVSLRPYVEYVCGRGVWDQALRAGAGAVYGGRFRGRVLVPVAERPGGPWQGFQARAIGGRDRLKYLGPANLPRNQLLMGREHLGASGPVYVVEGPFDFLPLIGEAVAPMGHGIGDDQLDLLAALGRPLVPCLDGDSWVMCRGLVVRLRLRGAEVPGWCHLPPATDPGKLGVRVREHLVAA